MTKRLNVLVLTTVFPNSYQPLNGLFVWERLRHLSDGAQLLVLAPVSWRWRHRITGEETREGVTVIHPVFLYIPRVLKFADGVWLFLSCLLPVFKIRRTFEFELIDAHFAFPEGFAAIALGKVFKVPVTITLRGNEVEFSREMGRGWAIRWALRRADRVIAVSHELAALARRSGASEHQIHVVPNGVDGHKFRMEAKDVARRALGAHPSEKVIVSVGHLTSRKRFDLLIDAVGLLHEAGVRVHLYVVGGRVAESGRYPDLLEAQVRDSQLLDVVTLLDAQPPAAIAKWFSAADISVLVSSREGCPNVVLESMSCGCPVVTTAVGEAPEMVPECAGRVIPADISAGQLAAALSDALHTEWDRERIRRYAEGKTWKSVGQDVTRSWHQAVSHHFLTRPQSPVAPVARR